MNTKKIFISFIICFFAMVASSILAMSVIGYDNFVIMQQKYVFSEEIAAKQAQIWDKYWLHSLLCFIPTLLSIMNLAYQFYKEFTDNSFWK